VWAMTLPALARYTLYPVPLLAGKFAEREAYCKKGFSIWRVALFCTGSAMLFALIEATRAHLFVWNDLSVTQWRNLPLLQMASWSGSYGITFVVVLMNSALFALCRFKRGWRWTLVSAALYLALCVWGSVRMIEIAETHRDVVWRPALVQGNLSQRRHATQEQALEALHSHLKLSYEVAGKKPEIILWPESAIPIPYRSSGSFGRRFRSGVVRFLAETRIPMVIGSLDYTPLADGNYGVTNSALLLDPDSGNIIGKHDKFIRVPYGEYIPFRQYLPEKLIEAIDMGRDLTPGASLQVLKVAPDVRAGVAICYEGVFFHLTRTHARRGANVLVVLSNDAWYPQSSELEQHLANSVIRSVETGLPMVRCNNNGASGVVSPAGKFTAGIGSRAGSDEIVRELASGVVEVRLNSAPRPTFFVRFGQWTVLLFALCVAAWFIFVLRSAFCVRRRLFRESL